MDGDSSTPLLQLSNVGRQFPLAEEKITVLKNINLTIHAGEMVAIVGQSGSGKSTLMNILGCLDRPSSGSYRINNREISTLDNNELAALRREHFGFIFQRYHLLSSLSAEENVEIPAIYAGIDKSTRRQRAQQLLARLGLSTRSRHRPNQLSGGQQQRVSIARALMNGGDVILADEPTGALDSHSSQEMMRVLCELHQQGHTVIIVTHDMQVAHYAQRIIEISDGEITADRRHIEADAITKDTRTAQLHSKKKSLKQRGWERFSEAFKMAWIAMLSHRMRTFLTMLGIIIGIASVASVVALSQGAQQSIIQHMQAIGTNTINIYRGKDWGDEKASTIKTLNSIDLNLLQSQFYVDSLTPNVSSSQTVRYGNTPVQAQIHGVSHQYFRVRNVAIAHGAIFDADAVHRQTQTVVIDDNTRQRLFKSWEDPLGKIIMIGKLPCVVIAVTKKSNSMFTNPASLEIFLPYTTAMHRLSGQNFFDHITIRLREGVTNSLAEQNITKLLTLRHGVKDFFTSSSDTYLKMIQKSQKTFTLLISALAFISLVVGGIGVMNIMLVSVTERTHEIGIRVAVGARQRDIMQQFLIEAVLVCLVGGLIGVALSYSIGYLFSLFTSAITMKFSISTIVMACLCSSFIGALFGFIPARNAARLDPIAALARE